VEVDGTKHQARFWYDGTWVNNAREDAAEVALQYLGIIPTRELHAENTHVRAVVDKSVAPRAHRHLSGMIKR
jgi:hypothetical protein